MTTKKPTKKKTTPKPAAKKTATRKKAAPKQKQNPVKDEPRSVDFTHQHEAAHVAAAETVKINIIGASKKKKSLWRRIVGFGF